MIFSVIPGHRLRKLKIVRGAHQADGGTAKRSYLNAPVIQSVLESEERNVLIGERAVDDARVRPAGAAAAHSAVATVLPTLPSGSRGVAPRSASRWHEREYKRGRDDGEERSVRARKNRAA